MQPFCSLYVEREVANPDVKLHSPSRETRGISEFCYLLCRKKSNLIQHVLSFWYLSKDYLPTCKFEFCHRSRGKELLARCHSTPPLAPRRLIHPVDTATHGTNLLLCMSQPSQELFYRKTYTFLLFSLYIFLLLYSFSSSRFHLDTDSAVLTFIIHCRVVLQSYMELGAETSTPYANKCTSHVR